MTVFVCQLHSFFQSFHLIVLFFQLSFAILASITDFAVGIKDLGLDGAVVVTAEDGGILLFFSGLCSKESATLFS